MLELIAHGDSPRFSDIARRLDLTQGTAHAILTTLTDRGWVTRDPADKSYSLGPAMAVVAARVGTARPLAQSARAVAAELSTSTGYPASVVERVEDSLVITAFEGGGPTPAGAPGERIRFAPPFGVAFAAWESPAGRRAWIERAPARNPELARRLGEILTRTRDRGYEVDWTTPALVQAAHLMSTLPDEGLPDHVREITDQLLVEFTTIGLLSGDDPARSAQPVATIAAPVFRDHRVALIVAIHPLCALPAAEVAEIGGQLVRATDEISSR